MILSDRTAATRTAACIAGGGELGREIAHRGAVLINGWPGGVRVPPAEGGAPRTAA